MLAVRSSCQRRNDADGEEWPSRSTTTILLNSACKALESIGRTATELRDSSTNSPMAKEKTPHFRNWIASPHTTCLDPIREIGSRRVDMERKQTIATQVTAKLVPLRARLVRRHGRPEDVVASSEQMGNLVGLGGGNHCHQRSPEPFAEPFKASISSLASVTDRSSGRPTP